MLRGRRNLGDIQKSLDDRWAKRSCYRYEFVDETANGEFEDAKRVIESRLLRQFDELPVFTKTVLKGFTAATSSQFDDFQFKYRNKIGRGKEHSLAEVFNLMTRVAIDIGRVQKRDRYWAVAIMDHDRRKMMIYVKSFKMIKRHMYSGPVPLVDGKAFNLPLLFSTHVLDRLNQRLFCTSSSAIANMWRKEAFCLKPFSVNDDVHDFYMHKDSSDFRNNVDGETYRYFYNIGSLVIEPNCNIKGHLGVKTYVVPGARNDNGTMNFDVKSNTNFIDTFIESANGGSGGFETLKRLSKLSNAELRDMDESGELFDIGRTGIVLIGNKAPYKVSNKVSDVIIATKHMHFSDKKHNDEQIEFLLSRKIED